MKNINCLLDEIIIRYKIYGNNTNFDKRYSALCSILDLLVSARKKNIFFYNNNDCILNEIRQLVIDYCPQFDYEYYFITQLEDFDYVDALLIDTNLRSNIIEKLKLSNEDNFMYINLYEYFAEKNLFFNQEFYLLYDDNIGICERVLLVKKQLNKSFDLNGLYELFFVLLLAKDFIGLFENIQKYMIEVEHQSEIISFRNEIHNLLYEIKNEIRNKKNERIVIQLMDSLMPFELEDMPYLESVTKSSLVFENAYTVTPWTKATYFTLFCKKKAIDDNIYDKDYKIGIKQENSIFLKILEDNNYTFKHFGEPVAIIDQAYNYDVSNSSEHKLISVSQWNALNQLVNEVDNTVYWIHSMESHASYSSLRTENKIYEIASAGSDGERLARVNRETALISLDEQISFFDWFLSESDIKIYMSDHGKFTQNMFQTVCFVKGNDIPKMKIEKTFSYYNFDLLIKYLLKYNEVSLEDIISDYAIIQDIDAYGVKRINEHLKLDLVYYGSLLGKKGIATSSDLYIKWNDDTEYYYVKPDFKFNKIGFAQYKSRIDYLKKIYEECNIKLLENDYLLRNSKIMECVGRYKERFKQLKGQCEVKLRELCESIPKDKIVAIRGGGEHTCELLKVIQHQINIKYIIDLELNDLIYYGDEYEYLLPRDMEKYNIDIVIVSSFRYREEMKKELQEKGYDYIDIYDWLRKNNIYLNQPFYGGHFLEKEDIVGIF